VFLLCSPVSTWATTLSDAAAALSAGQWVKITSTNAGLLSTMWAPNAGHGYDDGGMAWDSTSRKILHAAAEHGPFPRNAADGAVSDCLSTTYGSTDSGVCWKPLAQFDDATNTWSVAALLSAAQPPRVQGYHDLDNVTWDDVNKVLYIKQWATGLFYRYCVNNTPSWCTGNQATWSALPFLSGFDTLGAAAYHPTLNGGTLLVYGGDRGGSSGCGRLYGFRESTASWSTVDAGTSCKFNTGDYNNLAEHSPVKQVTIFGGGGGNQDDAHAKRLWKIDQNGTVTALADAPWPINFANINTRQALADPVSGDFIFIFGHSNTGSVTNNAELWRLNPNGSGTWTLLDGNLLASGKICETSLIIPCPNDLFGTAISTYGVLLFWKYTSSTTADLWMYKAGTGSGDTTAPTVSITVPTAGADVSGPLVTVTATASDNVGVAGVQFKVDGVNVGAEDTVSPYSIAWNSTTVTDGSHSITATARDAAGNTTTSTAVNVTVSNGGGGGGDFATRCAQPGVVRCVNFDQSAEISCTSWGCNQGLDLAGTTVAPALDTSIKASGASSLKFTITSLSGANGGGTFWTNFSPDLKTQFGAGQSFYIQWRQRFSPELINTIYNKIGGGNAGGWKQISITTGDQPNPGGACNSGEASYCQTQQGVAAYSSCTPIDIPVQNTEQRKYPQMYHSCSGSTSHGAYDAWVENFPPFAPADFKMQNARPSPYCLYSATASGTQFPPTGNCFGYFPNEWMTFKVKITIGQRGSAGVIGQAPNDEWVNSRGQLWVGREGQATVPVFDWTGPNASGYHLSAGTTVGDQKFGKVYLLPYHSYKDDTQVHATAYTWYDDLIISTNDIADPGAGPPVVNAPSQIRVTRR